MDEKTYKSLIEGKKREILGRLSGNRYGLSDNLVRLLEFRNNYKMQVTEDVTVDNALQLLTDIGKINDLDKLMQLSESLSDDKVNAFNKKVEPLKESKIVSEICKKEHAKSLTDFGGMDKETLGKHDGIDIDTVEGINVYNLKGVPFNLMIHYGDFHGNTNRPAGTSKLYTSLISSLTPIHTIGPESCNRFLVFNKVRPENINHMTTQDGHIGSLDATLKRQEEETEMLPREFIANMGSDYSDYEIDTSDGSLRPDAICVIGKASEADIQYAKSRGISAIYSIEEEKYKEQYKNAEMFEKKLAYYKQTLDVRILPDLKMQNPYGDEKLLETIYDTLSNSNNREAVNSNIYALQRTYKKDIEMAKNSPTFEKSAKLLEQMEKFNKLPEKWEEKIPEESLAKASRIQNLESLINIDSRSFNYDCIEAVLGILNSSRDVNKDINAILNIIQDNRNIEDVQKFKTLLGVCKKVNVERNNDEEINKKILDVKKDLSVEKLQEEGKIQNNGEIKIYQYFVEKDNDIENMVSAIENIDSKDQKAKENILGETIKETEEKVRSGAITQQANIIKGIVKSHDMEKNNSDVTREEL